MAGKESAPRQPLADLSPGRVLAREHRRRLPWGRHGALCPAARLFGVSTSLLDIPRVPV